MELYHFACTACSSTNFEIIYKVGIFSSKTDIVICRSCGLICLNPRWSDEDYDKYYMKYYYSDYMNISDIINKPYYIKENSRSGQIYEGIKNHVAKGEPVLEIGAGNGDNSVYLSQKGFSDISCVEIDPTCCKRISKHFPNVVVHCCSLAELSKNERNEKRYHMIILSHVAEHFVQPKLALDTIYDLLDEKGYLYVLVPNIFAAKRPYRYFTTPHTHYFSYATLKSILELSGLKVVCTAIHQFDEIAVIAQKSGERLNQIDAKEYKRAREFLMKRYYWDDLFRVKIRRLIEQIMSERIFQFIHNAVKKL